MNSMGNYIALAGVLLFAAGCGFQLKPSGYPSIKKFIDDCETALSLGSENFNASYCYQQIDQALTHFSEELLIPVDINLALCFKERYSRTIATEEVAEHLISYVKQDKRLYSNSLVMMPGGVKRSISKAYGCDDYTSTKLREE